MTDIFTETPTLDTFVGEGKKYSDNNAVAKALVEKDNFIARLIEEKRQLEADHRAVLNTKAFEDRIKALETAQTVAPEPPAAAVAPPVTPNIEDVVQRAIAEREAQTTRSRNLINVKDKLTEVFGHDYATKVKQRAAELQVSMERLNEMAAETPTAFFALLGLNSSRPVDPGVAPPATQFNSAAVSQPTGEKGNTYFSNLRKTNPGQYWSPSVQMEEYNQLKKLGADKFYAI